MLGVTSSEMCLVMVSSLASMPKRPWIGLATGVRLCSRWCLRLYKRWCLRAAKHYFTMLGCCCEDATALGRVCREDNVLDVIVSVKGLPLGDCRWRSIPLQIYYRAGFCGLDKESIRWIHVLGSLTWFFRVAIIYVPHLFCCQTGEFRDMLLYDS